MQNNNKVTQVLLAIIAVALILLIVMVATKRHQPVSTVSQNQVQSVQTTASSDTLIASNQAFFNSESAKPADFDNHFKVVVLSCGTNCEQYYAVDKNNGSVYKASVQAFPKGEWYLTNNQIFFSQYGTSGLFLEDEVCAMNDNPAGFTCAHPPVQEGNPDN
jgi:hypothetical protein